MTVKRHGPEEDLSLLSPEALAISDDTPSNHGSFRADLKIPVRYIVASTQNP